MNQKQKMLAELPYDAWDKELVEDRIKAKKLVFKINKSNPANRNKIKKYIQMLFGKTGKAIIVEPPFKCDYGFNIEVGENFYTNFNCTILDVAKVKIGNNVMFGPNVSVYTAGHPIHHEPRISGIEYGISIEIGDGVWIGGNSIINPGVKIGNNSVIGSGSVVTKDIPDSVVAAGNPCKIIRNITESDINYYFKNREIKKNI